MNDIQLSIFSQYRPHLSHPQKEGFERLPKFLLVQKKQHSQFFTSLHFIAGDSCLDNKIYPDSQMKQQNKHTLSSKNSNYGILFKQFHSFSLWSKLQSLKQDSALEVERRTGYQNSNNVYDPCTLTVYPFRGSLGLFNNNHSGLCPISFPYGSLNNFF